MNLLGIETATELVGVAVAGRDGRRAVAWATGRRRHGEFLAPAIAHVLEQAGLALGELDAVVVDVGPGLFTGLRVGLATAKGLAQGLGLGLLGLGSVEVLARAALDARGPASIVAVVDARRGEIFAARYRAAPDRLDPVLVEVAAPRLWAPDQLVEELCGLGEPLLAVGDGARRYAEALRGVPGLAVAGPSLADPAPGALVDLALERLAAGAALQSPVSLSANYLREADARINWVQREAVRR